jgi:hypothetical protein
MQYYVENNWRKVGKKRAISIDAHALVDLFVIDFVHATQWRQLLVYPFNHINIFGSG